MNFADMLTRLTLRRRQEAVRPADEPPFNTVAASLGRRTSVKMSRGDSSGSVSEFDPSRLRRWQSAVDAVCTSNGIAKAATEIVGDFVIGSGLKLSTAAAEGEGLRAIFDEHWFDEFNDWEQAQGTRARELGKSGELLLEIIIPPYGEGHLVRVAEIPIIDVLQYRVSRRFKHRVTHLKVRDSDNPMGRWLRVAATRQDGLFDLNLADDVVAGEAVSGLCVYATVNRSHGCPVGKPDLLSIVDHLDMLDNLVANVSDRAAFLNAHVYDLTVKGDEDAVSKVREEFGTAPPPGSSFVHGEGVELKPCSPDLKASDQQGVAELIEGMVFAGSRIAKHWLGRGDSANRATAAEMGDPMFRWLTGRQSQFVMFVEKIVAIQFQVALERAVLTHAEWSQPWRMVAPDVIAVDQAEASNIMANWARVLSLAKLDGFVDDAQARQMFREAAERLNIEIPELPQPVAPAVGTPDPLVSESTNPRSRAAQLVDFYAERLKAASGR